MFPIMMMFGHDPIMTFQIVDMTEVHIEASTEGKRSVSWRPSNQSML